VGEGCNASSRLQPTREPSFAITALWWQNEEPPATVDTKRLAGHRNMFACWGEIKPIADVAFRNCFIRDSLYRVNLSFRRLRREDVDTAENKDISYKTSILNVTSLNYIV